MQNVLVINGPNLNLLGSREPDIYGSTTLSQLESLLAEWGHARNVAVTSCQSNHEGEIIDRLHAARHQVDGVIINAGALTHYSYAIHDAIVATGLPTVEVHISNIKVREPWRRSSVVSPACVYVIYGRGVDGYRHALDHLVHLAKSPALKVKYGPLDDHVGDLRLPPGSERFPVAVLVHGGFWRDHWTRDIMTGPAIDLTNRGWATWNIEYRRVGSGGGWPATLEDVAAGIEHLDGMAADHPLDLDRVVTVGHSAGGQLALWAAVRPHLADGIPNPGTRVRLRGVLALAPVSDLIAGQRAAIGDGAVEQFLRRTPDDGADRYLAASPSLLLPLRTDQVVVHGTADDAVPVSMSQAYVQTATEAGDRVSYRELEGIDHMALIDPAHEAWETAMAELAEFH